MTGERSRVSTSALLERVVIVETAVKAAHHRIDRQEQAIGESLKKIESQLGAIMTDLKDVVAWQNRVRGWAAAALLASGILGAVASRALIAAGH